MLFVKKLKGSHYFERFMNNGKLTNKQNNLTLHQNANELYHCIAFRFVFAAAQHSIVKKKEQKPANNPQHHVHKKGTQRYALSAIYVML